jgi:type IV secretory pathway TraG/TraD family ATPase VirD4
MNLLSLFYDQHKPSEATSAGRWPLDLELIRWSKYPKDAFTLQDALQDVIVFGQKGSGKTSGTGRLIARKYLQAGFSGLVVCAQPEEADIWSGYLKEAGREADGVFFTLDGPHRFNPLAWEASQSGGENFAANVVNLLLDIVSVKKEGSPGQNDAYFWVSQRRQYLDSIVTLLMLGGEEIRLVNIHRLMASTPAKPSDADNTLWQRGNYLWDTLQKAKQKHPGHEGLENTRRYFLNDLAKLDDRPRGIIEIEAKGILHSLTSGKLSELFGGTTNVSPLDVTEGSKVIVVDIPALKHRTIGQLAALIWLLTFQVAAQRRAYTAPHTRPCFLYADEKQLFAIPETDARFQSTSRHHGVSVVSLTQSIPGLTDAYGGKAATDAALSHYCTRIFHANNCAVTNEWASRSLGKIDQVKQSLSSSYGRNGNHSQSWALETVDSCPTETFLGLQSGGPRHKGRIEAVMAQAGRTFLDGQRWIITEFRQAKP